MIFINEYGQELDQNYYEIHEQNMVRKYIEPNDVVLELGARYGLVSCAINNILNDKKNQVSVEPDSRVWNVLENNMNKNGCSFEIIRGFISKTKLGLTNHFFYGGFGTTSIQDEKSDIPSYTLEDIEINYGLKFNVLVADCEGFLEKFFDENPKLVKTLNKVIFEADYQDKCNYENIKNKLLGNNFSIIEEGFQNVYIKK